MKVAAGVILIIAAVFNLIVGLGYLGGGALSTGLSDAMNSTQMQEQRSQMTDEQKAEMDKASDAMGIGGMGLMIYGIFVLVSVGILIAGAVFLFTNKKAQFIMVAGGIAILVEVIAVFIKGFGLFNAVGIVGGVLAIICAKSMSGNANAPIETV